MDAARYYLALVIVIFTPGGLLFWLSVHPGIRFWRRVGMGVTYTLHFGGIIGLAVIAFLYRDWLMAVDFGTQPVLIALAMPVYAIAIGVAVARQRQLGIKTLLGLPELAPDRFPGRLITEGIYAHVRHPRYLEVMVWMVAHALLTNYMAMYVAALLWILDLIFVAWLEERELLDRFGDAYRRYCDQVPRFIPRWSGRVSSAP